LLRVVETSIASAGAHGGALGRKLSPRRAPPPTTRRTSRGRRRSRAATVSRVARRRWQGAPILTSV